MKAGEALLVGAAVGDGVCLGAGVEEEADVAGGRVSAAVVCDVSQPDESNNKPRSTKYNSLE